MRISCTQENLNQGLTIVGHIASKNTALPILNNVLISASKNNIKLSATNLEIGVSCTIRGKIEEDGDFTVNSRLISDYVSFLPKDRVDLISPSVNKDGVDQSLSINCKNNSTKIKGQEATDFPLIPQIEKNNFYILGGQDFRQAISQVIFSTSVNEARPEINGVAFNFNDGHLVMAATDSYRLAEKTIKLGSKTTGENQQVIIPTRTLQEIQRILGSFKDPASISNVEDVEIYLAENQVMFSLGGIELISRLVEGKYPDYKQIIPQDSTTKAILGTQDFIKATKTTSLFARSGIYDVSLKVFSKPGELVVSSVNSQLGENTSRLNAEITGGDNDTVINYRYLLDGLQNLGSDQVEFSLTTGSNPCVLKPTNQKDYLYIIMPIKQ